MPDIVNTPVYPELRATAAFHAFQFSIYHDDAEDYTQSFIVHILQRSQRFSLLKLSPTARRAYLHCAAHRYAINFRRSRSRLNEFEFHFSEMDFDEISGECRQFGIRESSLHSYIEPETTCLQRMMSEELANALSHLQHDLRSILELRYFEDLNSSEIALVTGHTSDAIRQQLCTGRKKLRSLIVNSGWDEEELNFALRLFS